MSSSNQVGFSFQADVVGGASLVYSGTGRLLKYLSDGGIDAYAIMACMELSRTIPITATQEMTTSRLLASRGGRAGFLVKALHIGWGHSDIAMELARTRAGTAAMILVNALATGGTSFDAAVALQNLMELNGCEPSMLPNVDVLLTMVRYIAPLLYDSGFKPTLQQILDTLSKDPRLGLDVIGTWNTVGDSLEWCKAARQLAFSAERKEHVYLITEQRGAWLAAFAVHVLRMAVEIKVRSTIIWESAGSQGLAVFELDSTANEDFPYDSTLRIERPATNFGYRPLIVDHAMHEALQHCLSTNSRIDYRIVDIIYSTILKTTHATALECRIRWSHVGEQSMSLLNKQKILQVCHDLGIPSEWVDQYDWKEPTTNGVWFAPKYRALRYVAPQDLKVLESICGLHSTNPYATTKECLCNEIGLLIHGTASTILSLVPCGYHAQEIRVSSQVLVGNTNTGWNDCLANRKGLGPLTGPAILTNTQLMSHLSHLVHDPDIAFEPTSRQINDQCNILAVSLGHVSIFHKSILDKDCVGYNRSIIEIQVGRLTLNKLPRTLVEQHRLPAFSEKTKPPSSLCSTWTRIARGVSVAPHYSEVDTHAILNASLAENSILISCEVKSKDLVAEIQPFPIDICYCIGQVMSCHWPDLGFAENRDGFVYECGHERGSPLTVDEDVTTVISPLFGTSSTSLGLWTAEYSKLILYALKGRSLEQIIQASFLQPERTFMQIWRCLPCTHLDARMNWDPHGVSPDFNRMSDCASTRHRPLNLEGTSISPSEPLKIYGKNVSIITTD